MNSMTEWDPKTTKVGSTPHACARAYLERGIQADSLEVKNYAIRSALQLLVTAKWHDSRQR